MPEGAIKKLISDKGFGSSKGNVGTSSFITQLWSVPGSKSCKKDNAFSLKSVTAQKVRVLKTYK